MGGVIAPSSKRGITRRSEAMLHVAPKNTARGKQKLSGHGSQASSAVQANAVSAVSVQAQTLTALLVVSPTANKSSEIARRQKSHGGCFATVGKAEKTSIAAMTFTLESWDINTETNKLEQARLSKHSLHKHNMEATQNNS